MQFFPLQIYTLGLHQAPGVPAVAEQLKEKTTSKPKLSRAENLHLLRTAKILDKEKFSGQAVCSGAAEGDGGGRTGGEDHLR